MPGLGSAILFAVVLRQYGSFRISGRLRCGRFFLRFFFLLFLLLQFPLALLKLIVRFLHMVPFNDSDI